MPYEEVEYWNDKERKNLLRAFASEFHQVSEGLSRCQCTAGSCTVFEFGIAFFNDDIVDSQFVVAVRKSCSHDGICDGNDSVITLHFQKETD